MMKTRFWNWQGDAGNRELYLYGTIAPESWYEDDVTPELFRSELNAGTGPVTIWLSSPGGDCVAASQIYTMLMDYPFDVTVKIDGIAASAASVIAMAGTKVLMAPDCLPYDPRSHDGCNRQRSGDGEGHRDAGRCEGIHHQRLPDQNGTGS